MITVDQALISILSQFAPLPAVQTPILDTLGQILAEDVRSTVDVPPLTNAAMDGYAVRAADLADARQQRPVTLRVIEDLPAGRTAAARVEPGSTIRIMTGAPLPDGADTVVQFELTSEGGGGARGSTIEVYTPIKPELNIRRAGEDLRRGEVTLAAGTPLRPAEVGLLATMGLAHALVHRRPRVAVLSTGDELLPPGAPWSPGKIYDSNSYTLAAMSRQAGAEPCMMGIAPDRLDRVVQRVEQARDVDLFVTSAGVSAGDYDVVKQALTRVGDVGFYQVRMRPGRPLAFGHLRGVPLLGLPGNPVAAAISFELFGRPAIKKMLGYRSWGRPEISASFEGSVENYDARKSFYRVRVERRPDGDYLARLTGPQGSGILTSLARANGLMVVDEDTPRAVTGDRVIVRLIDSEADDVRS